jgi:hypothetical protein
VNRQLRLFHGRLCIYLEPRDLWLGAYIGDDHVYVCPLPLLVFRFARDWKDRPDA